MIAASAPNLISTLSHSPPKSGPQCSIFWALLSHYYSRPDSIYLSPDAASQQGASLILWLNPHCCIESLCLEESLPLHQSDPYVKASNLPYIILINWISCFYRESTGNFSADSLLFIHCFLSPVHWCSLTLSHSLANTHLDGKTQPAKCVAIYALPQSRSHIISHFLENDFRQCLT